MADFWAFPRHPLDADRANYRTVIGDRTFASDVWCRDVAIMMAVVMRVTEVGAVAMVARTSCAYISVPARATLAVVRMVVAEMLAVTVADL